MWSKRAMLHCSSWNKAPGFMTRLMSSEAVPFFKHLWKVFSGVTRDTSTSEEQRGAGASAIFFFFFFPPRSDLHPEARRQLEIAQTCSTESKQNAVGVVSCKTSSAVPLISRDRGRCRTGARRRSRSAGWGSPQKSVPVEGCGCVSGEACVLLCWNFSPATCAHMFAKCHKVLDAYLIPVMENNKAYLFKDCTSNCGARFLQINSIFKPKTLTLQITAAQKKHFIFSGVFRPTRTSICWRKEQM